MENAYFTYFAYKYLSFEFFVTKEFEIYFYQSFSCGYEVLWLSLSCRQHMWSQEDNVNT